MAVTDAYATVAEYRAMLDKLDDSDDEVITSDLLAASRFIERELGQFFTKDASAVARVFLPSDRGDSVVYRNGATLYLPPMAAAPTEVIIDTDGDGSFADETALAAGDYELLPRNAAFGPEPQPYSAIRLTEYGDYGTWYASQRVRVTAQWGWPSVPPAVKRLCVELVGMVRLETPRATVNIVEGFDRVTQTSPMAQGLLTRLKQSYRRKTYG